MGRGASPSDPFYNPSGGPIAMTKELEHAMRLRLLSRFALRCVSPFTAAADDRSHGMNCTSGLWSHSRRRHVLLSEAAL